MSNPVVPSWADSDENLGRNCVTVLAAVAAFLIFAPLVALGHVEIALAIVAVLFGALTLVRMYFGRRLELSGTFSEREIVCELSLAQAFSVLEKTMACLDLATVLTADESRMSIVVTVPPSWASTTGERISGTITSSSEGHAVVRFESEQLEFAGAFDPRKNEQNLDEAGPTVPGVRDRNR